MNDQRDDIRDAVIAEMKRQNVSAYRIANDLKISPQTVKPWLDGKSSINTKYASAIVRYLGLRFGTAAK